MGIWAHQPIFPLYRIYASVNWVNIGSDYDLSSGRPKAITWINADLLKMFSASSYIW